MSECKHLNSQVRPFDPIGYVHCEDCGELHNIFTVMRNFYEEISNLLAKVKEKVDATAS